ncbi:MAG: SMR family transporter [Minisyncoccia bacterium]
MYILFITFAFIFNAVANIMLKIGAKKGFVFHGFSYDTISDNILFLLGFIFFGLNAIFYFIALSTIPISIAYPVMVGMSLILINAFALIYLGEQITTMQVIGYILLFLGVIIIFSFSAQK